MVLKDHERLMSSVGGSNPLSRICLVCISLRPGGTERVVSRFANYLGRRHEVFVMVLSKAPSFYQLSDRVTLIQPDFGSRRKLSWLWYFRMVAYLWNELDRVRPTTVWCFGETIAPAVLLVSRLRGLPTIVFNRASPLSSLRGVRGVLNPLFYPIARCVVVQTRASIDLLRRRYKRVIFEVLPNPVNVPDIVPPISDRPPHIITVGTLGGRKNQEHLIRAFAALPEKPTWVLNIVGDGPDRDRLEALSRTLCDDGRVRFLGLRDDVDALLQSARIFAFSSLTEGFPNALAEALAAGCACVSYDCPTGPSDLIQNGLNGILIPNGSYEEFEEALGDLVSDDNAQVRLSQAARLSIETFSEKEVFDRLDHLLVSTSRKMIEP